MQVTLVMSVSMCVSPAHGPPANDACASNVCTGTISASSRFNGESVTQHAPHGSRPKKKKAQVVSQPIIKEANEEVAVEELTGKEATLEEANVEVTAPEEVPVVNAPPCLEELVWVTLQEVCKKCKSTERREHFEFRIWEELWKLVTLKGREVASAQGNVGPGSSGCHTGKCHSGEDLSAGERERKAIELEEEEENMA